jgi:predicted flap endonuclease-1-like 5' DNA nuclease
VIALIAAAVLLSYEIPPIPTWFYVFAWYPTLVALDQGVVLLGGESLLERPRDLVLMLWWSAVIWFLFEALNFRLQNWYYVFLPASRLDRWLGITISLATVVPAVFLGERLLDRLGVWRDLRWRQVPLEPKHLPLVAGIGVGLLAATLVFPRFLHPLTWVAVWLVIEPLLYARDPERSLFADAARGSWGRIVRLLAAGLFAGVLWETFNSVARGRWIYTVPFLEGLKIFEMPVVGFLGFPFFALEVWSLYHLLAATTSRRTLVASVVFGLLVLAGIDHWTVSSTAPRLADLPGVPNAVLYRVRDAGWTDVFSLARTPAAEIAYRTNLSPADARTVREAARLATLRGIGTAHAATLIGGGIGTVEELAAAAPDSVWRLARDGPRPTPAEVRVWVQAAQRAIRASAPVRDSSDRRSHGTGPGAGADDGRRDLFQIGRAERERRGPDPAVHLLRRPRAHDRSGDARPRERPGDCDGRRGRAVPPGDRLEGVAQREVSAQARLVKLRAATPPVIGSERGDSRGREAVREEAGLHRAIRDDARPVLRAPGDLPSRDIATDERERRL